MLKTSYPTKEEIPDGLQEHYVEKDGIFILDGFVPKGKLTEFRDNNRNLAKEKEVLQAQLLKFKDIDPEKYAESVEKLQELENNRLEEAGEFKLLTAQRDQAHADELAKQKSKAKVIQDTLDGERIDNATARLVLQYALPAEGNMRYIQADIREAASIDAETGNVVFLDEKGLKIKNEEGELLTHEAYIEAYIPKSNLFQKSSGGGALGGDTIHMISKGQVKVDSISGKDISGDMLSKLANGEVEAVI